MASIITSILGSTVGLLLNKARASVVNKLKDGGLTDQQLREIIVRDLDDVKTKLDYLSLKDLDSSYSFLKEGVSLLNHAFEKSSNDEKSSEVQAEATAFSKDSASGILNAALSLPQAIQRLKISSEKRFASAENCFKASRERATDAFNNKSLSIKDRIMACKLRVVARILELGLEDPEAATTACLLSLEELHGLPAIKDMLSVFLNGGLKSKLKKAERWENIMSVLSINDALFDFAAKYSSQYPNVFTWPGIVLTDRTLNPILNTREILAKTSVNEELVQQLNRTVIFRIYFEDFAVNSCGEVIRLDYYENKITVIYSTGKSKDVVFPDATERNMVKQASKAIAVDSDDNVYVVRWLQTRDENVIKGNYELLVFDENHNLKCVSMLDFFNVQADSDDVRIAVDKNKNLIMFKYYDNQVYVCDNTGQLKFKFERNDRLANSLCISDKNDIMIPSDDRRAVQIYTREGNLKSTIKLPEGHKVRSVAFHHSICKIIVSTCVWEQDSYFLLCYSETGELENTVFLCKVGVFPRMTNHPSGPVAIQFGIIVIFI